MSLKLRWIASVSTSALHIAEALSQGKTIIDPRLSDSILESSRELQDEILKSSLPAERLWRQLVALSHHIENNRELAETAIRKTVGWHPTREALAMRLGERIAGVEMALQRAVPGIVDELASRSGPIREQWEARGPGLLRLVGKLTDERLIVETADVVLVIPALGGGGAAHLSNNSVRLEAVLTNNLPQLPEVVRLGWLIAQLQCDLPVFSERLSADHLPLTAQLALLPPVLEAAQEVELVTADSSAIATAISAWQIQAPFPDTSETLAIWWRTYVETRPEWGTALAALDQMLFRETQIPQAEA